MPKIHLRIVELKSEIVIDHGGLEVQAASGYVIRDNGRGAPTITCLTCARTSSNKNDVEQRYCGHCNKFHEAS